MLIGVLILAAALSFANAAEKELPPMKLGVVRREPVAAIFWNDKLAVIACAKSGTLIFWNIERGEIEQEFQVGRGLRGVARFDDEQLLAIDDKSHELILLKYVDRKLTELARAAVPAYPVSVIAWEDFNVGPTAAVASLWSRQVSYWSRAGRRELSQRGIVELSFEPRQLIPYLTDDSPIALAAFGGRSAVVQSPLKRAAALGNAEFSSIAFRRRLYGTRQNLDQKLPLTFDYVSQGSIMQNELLVGLRQIPLAREDSCGITHNDQNADPAGIAFVNDGILVCLAGADQVWYRSSLDDEHPQRIPVGKRPRTIISNDKLAFVLGELDDTISLIEFKDPERPTVTTKLLDPALENRELSPAERGERLFFSAKMSAGGMMTCNTCHPDGHTNGLLADTLGDNTHGTPKRVLTLRGTRLTDLWSWNGEMKTLQDNVHKSLRETMHAPEIKPADVDDIVSFLHTLPPVPPLKPVALDAADRASVARGEKVFAREGCVNCHVPPLTFTSHGVFDVGLADEKKLKKFNPPSLRGVGRLKKLFHDNRADSLRDVFVNFGHQLNGPLSEADLTDLIRYLESL